MSNKITIENPDNTTELRWLNVGECFLFKGALYMYRGVIMKGPLGREVPSDFIVVIKLEDGTTAKMGKHTEVEPVDIEIKVVRK